MRTGKVSLSWMGTRPRLLLADPELMRLVFTDTSGHIVKPPQNALVSLLQLGVATLEGDKWAKRRRLMTPAFHAERLKVASPPESWKFELSQEFLKTAFESLESIWTSLLIKGDGTAIQMEA